MSKNNFFLYQATESLELFINNHGLVLPTNTFNKCAVFLGRWIKGPFGGLYKNRNNFKIYKIVY